MIGRQLRTTSPKTGPVALPEPNVDALAAELDVDTRAQADGQSELPASDSDLWSACEQAIVRTGTDRLRGAQSAAATRLANQRDARGGLELDSLEAELNNLPVRTELEIDRIKAEQRQRLSLLRADAEREHASLADFQGAHGLARAARYPESWWLHYAVIALFFLLETLANAYFFAKGSPLGLLGGWLQASLIALANIGAAVLAGLFLMRELHHRLWWRKLAGTLGILAYAAGLIAFNLLVAHYRVALESDPLTAMARSLETLTETPLHLPHVEAWTLWLIGIVFGVVAAYKGYTADDPYPGYGVVARRAIAARNRAAEAKTDTLAAIREAVDAAMARSVALAERMREVAARYRHSLAESRALMERLQQVRFQWEDAINTLLARYRSQNRAARTTASPAHFYTLYRNTEAEPPELGGVDDDARRLAELEHRARAGGKLVAAVQLALRDLNKRELDGLDQALVGALGEAAATGTRQSDGQSDGQRDCVATRDASAPGSTPGGSDPSTPSSI